MLDRTAYRYAIVGLAAAVGLFLIGVSVIAAVGHEVPKELWTVGTALGGGLLGVLIPSPQATPGSKAVAESTTVQNAAATAATKAAEDLAKQAPVANGENADETIAHVTKMANEAVSMVKAESNVELALAAASANPGVGAAGAVLAAKHDQTAKGLEAQAKQPNQTPAQQQALNAQAHVFRAAASAADDEETRKTSQKAAQTAPKGQASNKDYFTKLVPPALVFVAALGLGSLLTLGVIAPEHAYQAAAIKEGDGLIALATAAGGAIVGVLAPSPGQKKPTSGE